MFDIACGAKQADQPRGAPRALGEPITGITVPASLPVEFYRGFEA